MVENREVRGSVEGCVLDVIWETLETAAGLEREAMREEESQVRGGDLWVSRLNAEQEADMMTERVIRRERMGGQQNTQWSAQ